MIREQAPLNNITLLIPCTASSSMKSVGLPEGLTLGLVLGEIDGDAVGLGLGDPVGASVLSQHERYLLR